MMYHKLPVTNNRINQSRISIININLKKTMGTQLFKFFSFIIVVFLFLAMTPFILITVYQTRLRTIAEEFISKSTGYHTTIGSIDFHLLSNLKLQLNNITVFKNLSTYSNSPYTIQIGKIGIYFKISSFLQGKFTPQYLTINNAIAYTENKIFFGNVFSTHHTQALNTQQDDKKNSHNSFNLTSIMMCPLFIKNLTINIKTPNNINNILINHGYLTLKPDNKTTQLTLSSQFDLMMNRPSFNLKLKINSKFDLNPEHTQIHPTFIDISTKLHSPLLNNRPFLLNLHTRFIATNPTIHHYTLHLFELNLNQSGTSTNKKKFNTHYFSPLAQTNRKRYPLEANAITIIKLKANSPKSSSQGYLRITQRKKRNILFKLTFNQINFDYLRAWVVKLNPLLGLSHIFTVKNISHLTSNYYWNIRFFIKQLTINKKTIHNVKLTSMHKSRHQFKTIFSTRNDKKSFASTLIFNTDSQPIHSQLTINSTLFPIDTVLPNRTLSGNASMDLNFQSRSTSFKKIFGTFEGGGYITIKNGALPPTSPLYSIILPVMHKLPRQIVQFKILSSHLRMNHNTLKGTHTLITIKKQQEVPKWSLTLLPLLYP